MCLLLWCHLSSQESQQARLVTQVLKYKQDVLFNPISFQINVQFNTLIYDNPCYSCRLYWQNWYGQSYMLGIFSFPYARNSISCSYAKNFESNIFMSRCKLTLCNNTMSWRDATDEYLQSHFYFCASTDLLWSVKMICVCNLATTFLFLALA